MGIFIVFLSLIFFLIGLAFIYEPTWLVRINKILRERVFNDNLILLERRKKGFLFILLFFITLYWGIHHLQYFQHDYSYEFISNDRLLYQSLQHLHAKQYQKAKLLCEKVLSRNPDHPEALYQLGAAQLLLKNISDAQECWSKAAGIDPQSPEARRLKTLVSKLDHSVSAEAASLE